MDTGIRMSMNATAPADVRKRRYINTSTITNILTTKSIMATVGAVMTTTTMAAGVDAVTTITTRQASRISSAWVSVLSD